MNFEFTKLADVDVNNNIEDTTYTLVVNNKANGDKVVEKTNMGLSGGVINYTQKYIDSSISDPIDYIKTITLTELNVPINGFIIDNNYEYRFEINGSFLNTHYNIQKIEISTGNVKNYELSGNNSSNIDNSENNYTFNNIEGTNIEGTNITGSTISTNSLTTNSVNCSGNILGHNLSVINNINTLEGFVNFGAINTGLLTLKTDQNKTKFEFTNNNNSDSSVIVTGIKTLDDLHGDNTDAINRDFLNTKYSVLDSEINNIVGNIAFNSEGAWTIRKFAVIPEDIRFVGGYFSATKEVTSGFNENITLIGIEYVLVKNDSTEVTFNDVFDILRAYISGNNFYMYADCSYDANVYDSIDSFSFICAEPTNISNILELRELAQPYLYNGQAIANWDSSVSYNVGDCVWYQDPNTSVNNIFICISNSTNNTPPTSPTTSNTYWSLLTPYISINNAFNNVKNRLTELNTSIDQVNQKTLILDDVEIGGVTYNDILCFG